eukprot:1605057-Prymnesium_polylepis.2
MLPSACVIGSSVDRMLLVSSLCPLAVIVLVPLFCSAVSLVQYWKQVRLDLKDAFQRSSFGGARQSDGTLTGTADPTVRRPSVPSIAQIGMDVRQISMEVQKRAVQKAQLISHHAASQRDAMVLGFTSGLPLSLVLVFSVS